MKNLSAFLRRLSLLIFISLIAVCCTGCNLRPIFKTGVTKPPITAKTPVILRGAMIGPTVAEADLRELASWGANHIRFQMNWNTFPQSPADSATRAEYSVWLDTQLKRLDSLLPVCKELGIYVVIDMHTPVCGRYQDGSTNPLIFNLFRKKVCQQEFVEDWKMISKKYAGNQVIWGYDLLNEPHEGTVPAELMAWRQLAETTIKEIRVIDPAARIIYETAIDTLNKEIEEKREITPLSYSNIAYSIHMYSPAEFTHQGTGNYPYPVHYPAKFQGTYWDLAQQRKNYQPLVDFQKKYQVPIYIGEFSVIRWAPAADAERLLTDFITIIEENGWNAAYHAFREWEGWSVEYDSNYLNKSPTSYTTKRKQILLNWYAKN